VPDSLPPAAVAGAVPELLPGAVAPELRDAILAWFDAEGRPLAFRATSDPWAILVSEAMAQQTQAARAAEAWGRFLAEFPTVRALAAASPAAVLRAWRGLGYNRRALALRRAAIAIVEDHGGHVPSDLEALLRLPGVGPYTARAIAALAFGRRVGAVDVNVRRVLNRAVGGRPGAFDG
jgi:A/G-specific adenine glycosylase